MNNENQTAANAVSNVLFKRILYVLFGIFIFRLGAHIPVPGIDINKLASFFNQSGNALLGFFNMFSGGALRRFTVFSLGIMPYISSSIVMQLLTVISPTFEEYKKEGEQGRRKINQYTRYMTIILSMFQGFAAAKLLANNGMAPNPDFIFYATTIITLVTGTMFLMWLGEQMTERGIGNGISLLIFAGIVANLPSSLSILGEQIADGQIMPIGALILLCIFMAVIFAIVFVERGQRKITVNYARRMERGGMYSNQSSHLPLKINMSGVIPPIFASTLLIFPATLAQWIGGGKNNTGYLGDIGLLLSPGQPLYLILFSLAIAFFCFFYTALVFNPNETAENLKKSGALVPGIRPGKQTAEYIDTVMARLTVFGAIYLVLVSLFPEFLRYSWNIPISFGGTSLLIIVVVIMDFWAQVQSHLLSQQYSALMKKGRSRSKFKGRKVHRV